MMFGEGIWKTLSPLFITFITFFLLYKEGQAIRILEKSRVTRQEWTSGLWGLGFRLEYSKRLL